MPTRSANGCRSGEAAAFIREAEQNCNWASAAGARACGITQTLEVQDQAGVEKLAGLIGSFRETLFARVRIAADEPTRVLPSKDGVELKLRFRKAVAAAG